MRKASFVIFDVLKATGVGVTFGVVITVLSALFGLIFGLVESLEVGQRIEFIIGSVSLFFLGIIILASGKKPRFGKISNTEEWRKYFKVINFAPVIGFMGIGFLIVGIVVDYWIIFLKG